MFITPNELAIMYQLWRRLSEKCLFESCAVVKNGLPNTNFSGTYSFMKIRSCGLTNSFSRLYTSASSLYDSISHALKYISACCVWCRHFRGSSQWTIQIPHCRKELVSLDLNEALFCRGLDPRVLCHKEMTMVGAYPVQVKLSCPLWLLSQWEEMVFVELSYHLGSVPKNYKQEFFKVLRS
jgi:hypothetical protein